MPVLESNDASVLERSLRRLRRRLTAGHALGLVPWALAASLALTLLACALLGAAPTLPSMIFAGLSPLIPWVAFGVVLRRRMSAHRGPSAARALSGIDPWLSSALASAAQFAGDTQETSLVAAHRAQVVARLSSVSFRDAVPLVHAAGRSFALILASLALALPVFALSPEVRMGAYALTHPFARSQGTRLSAVVERLEVHVTPPPHRGMPNLDVRDATRLEIPEGSRVRFVAHLRTAALDAELSLGTERLRLRRRTGRRFIAETEVRSGGPLTLRARTEEGWLRDATARSVVVLDDAPPAVRIVRASPESPVPADAEIQIVYQATDDVGLGEIARVVLPPSGEELRTVLALAPPGTRSRGGETRLSVRELGLRPGDAFTVVIEVTDRDAVDGPKTVRSEAKSFVVDDGRHDRELATDGLRGLLDASLEALATRLEADLPADEHAFVVRAERLATSVTGLLERVRAFADSETASQGMAAPDRGFLRALQQRLAPLPAADRASATRSASEIARTDERATTILEDATLGLADLLGRAELDDAASLAREIAALQRELTSLVRELRENPSDSLRRAVRATVERIQRRMSELQTRLASMQEELPSEFRNSASGSLQRAQGALNDLQSAFEGDDFDAMDRSVAALEQALRDMTQRSEGAESEFSQSRFGPRQQAFTDAFQRLAELEIEEQALAADSARVRDSLSSRATEGLDDASVASLSGLADEAGRLDRALAQLERMRGAPIDRSTLESARARVGDARDAMRRGNVGDARQSLSEATAGMEAIAQDLELSRRMFDGAGGRIAQAAEAARSSADGLRELDDAVTRMIPSLETHLRAVDDAALRSNAERQTRAEEVAGQIAEALDGRELGEPLAPDVAQGMREASTMMSEARNALFNRDPIGAASAQSRAARKLRELRENIERQSSSSSGGGGGGGGGEDTTGGERVELPGATTSEDAAARRRRVLDAMGEDVPEAYRGSVRRYYEELLR